MTKMTKDLKVLGLENKTKQKNPKPSQHLKTHKRVRLRRQGMEVKLRCSFDLQSTVDCQFISAS